MPAKKVEEILFHLKSRNLFKNIKFQGEFGMTLSGMMNALADIQRRGDLMLEGVRNKLNHPANLLSIKDFIIIYNKSVQILPPIFTSLNRYRIYVIILTGENLSSIVINLCC